MAIDAYTTKCIRSFFDPVTQKMIEVEMFVIDAIKFQLMENLALAIRRNT